MIDIMIVDDTITNLKVLSQILREQGYKLRIIPNGSLALKAIEIQKPDLILLDIMMPQINGYEMCKKLKEDKGTMDIPVIFISALTETESIVEGFKIGGVDYITKPFKTEEVIARVETQLKIIEANRKNRELLSKTFVGSVQIMTDILSTLKPELYIHATKLRNIVRDVAEILKLENSWNYEITAMLSRIGYLSLSDKQLLDYIDGNIGAISSDEHHDAITFSKSLVHHIPNLEPINNIFDKWYVEPEKEFFKTNINDCDPSYLGANLIKLIIKFNEMTSKGENEITVLDNIRKGKDNYHNELIEALHQMTIGALDGDEIAVKLSDLRVGMKLSRNVISKNQVVLLSHGTEISAYLINLLKRFEHTNKLREPIYVWKK